MFLPLRQLQDVTVNVWRITLWESAVTLLMDVVSLWRRVKKEHLRVWNVQRATVTGTSTGRKHWKAWEAEWTLLPNHLPAHSILTSSLLTTNTTTTWPNHLVWRFHQPQASKMTYHLTRRWSVEEGRRHQAKRDSERSSPKSRRIRCWSWQIS